MMQVRRVFRLLFASVLFCCGTAWCVDAPVLDYDQLVVYAARLLNDGNLPEAMTTARQAMAADSKRYEAYAVAAKIASKQGDSTQARDLITKALDLAPEAKKETVRQLAQILRQETAPSQSGSPALSGEDKLNLNVLIRLMEKAAKAEAEERAQLFKDFLERSAGFLTAHPEQTNIWAYRAAAALELNRPHEGWEAGQHLRTLGQLGSDDPAMSKVLADLELKGWLGAQPTWPKPDQSWTNSLGQVFVPVAGTKVLFCIWHTRLRDFDAFVQETGYIATEGMRSYAHYPWPEQRGNTWKSPGFDQGPTHPVCGVSWNDARSFCQWLTEKERRKGLLQENQSYRLPTDAEWSIAVGSDTYPWGDQWPPPPGAGNYAGSEVNDGTRPPKLGTIGDYTDAYPRTSPVGSFPANRHGLFDMGGNLWQWCEDDNYKGDQRSRPLRGGSWVTYISSSSRPCVPDYRGDFVGFRCVLVAVSSL